MAFISLFGFQRKDPPLIGLDIDAAALRMVELSRNRRGVHHAISLERLAYEALPPAAIDGRQIHQPGQVIDALRRLWQRSGARTTRVAIALPASAMIAHRMSLPAGLADEHLEIQIHNAARDLLPFPLEEVSLDFELLAPSAVMPDRREIQLAAARRSDVELRTALVAEAGLQAVIVDCDRYAAFNALARAQPGANDIILLQLGSHDARLILMRGTQILLERELPATGKHNHHASRATPDSVGDSDHLLALLVRMATQPLPSQADEDGFVATPGRICLAGELAHRPGLPTALSQATGLPVGIIEVFSGMHVSPAAQAAVTASSWLVACGLALRTVRPLPDERVEHRGNVRSTA